MSRFHDHYARKVVPALMEQFKKTSDAKKDLDREQVKNLLVGAGVVAALVWLLSSKG